jgi:hypothetical protein
VVPAALGPGDDDPRSPARVLGPDTARAPRGPGDQDGAAPDFDVIVPSAFGPGDTHFVRHVTRVPRPAAATTNEE